MKTGIELIAEERKEQIEKHGRTLKTDIKNKKHQLSFAAQMLAHPMGSSIEWDCDVNIPKWDKSIWYKMIKKPYKERLVIAGALIAAEIDRLNYISNELKD